MAKVMRMSIWLSTSSPGDVPRRGCGASSPQRPARRSSSATHRPLTSWPRLSRVGRCIQPAAGEPLENNPKTTLDSIRPTSTVPFESPDFEEYELAPGRWRIRRR